jgi:hypothetical protein
VKIGFTGTQVGMSDRQKQILQDMLAYFRPLEFHHGDCIGADAEAHDIVASIGLKIVIHPPLNGSKRAFKTADVVLEAKDYLQRNHDIVDATEVLIVAPKTDQEELRSGTWATYRYGVRTGKNVLLLAR